MKTDVKFDSPKPLPKIRPDARILDVHLSTADADLSKVSMPPTNYETASAEDCGANPGADNCAAVAASLSTRGPDGKLKSVISGHESDAELRGIVVWLAENCSASRLNPECPFSILKEAYRGSMNALMNGMTRAAMLRLIGMEEEARNNQPALCGQRSAARRNS
ncbi:MAG: hypothetical protein ABSH48_03725 [Verrucomicrobiota bacterium]